MKNKTPAISAVVVVILIGLSGYLASGFMQRNQMGPAPVSHVPTKVKGVKRSDLPNAQAVPIQAVDASGDDELKATAARDLKIVLGNPSDEQIDAWRASLGFAPRSESDRNGREFAQENLKNVVFHREKIRHVIVYQNGVFSTLNGGTSPISAEYFIDPVEQSQAIRPGDKIARVNIPVDIKGAKISDPTFFLEYRNHGKDGAWRITRYGYGSAQDFNAYAVSQFLPRVNRDFPH